MYEQRQWMNKLDIWNVNVYEMNTKFIKREKFYSGLLDYFQCRVTVYVWGKIRTDNTVVIRVVAFVFQALL